MENKVLLSKEFVNPINGNNLTAFFCDEQDGITFNIKNDTDSAACVYWDDKNVFNSKNIDDLMDNMIDAHVELMQAFFNAPSFEQALMIAQLKYAQDNQR